VGCGDDDHDVFLDGLGNKPGVMSLFSFRLL
jgi:hypothetical protein